ncbi:hypothetical protein OUZ56_027436 [Daphnia magna]|uniref:ZP domain-containing protein n=1 Tax=Daphnia magna TaxID=35525 RepID=A0ABQ9ZPR9_9CRUS|nr:hypothetical protein OUZ56_027436 [Daphnia magna]
MPAAEPVACIPAINVPQEILTLLEGNYCLHEDHYPVQGCVLSPVNDRVFIYFELLTISPQHPSFYVLEHCCVVRKTSVIGLQILIFFRYNTAVLTTSGVSPPVDQTQLYFLRLPVVVVYDFTSSLPSLTSSPSSPSRRLGRLRLHLRLVVLVVFAFISVSSSPSFAVSCLISVSPSSLRHHLVPGFSFILYKGIHRGSSLWDRPQWPSPQGALGNAPVGTSLCRCGVGFLRVCIPCNGFRHHVSPDLSSDKSHLVRDPYDAMRSNCSLSNLRVAWPGSQRWWNCWEEVGQ